MASFNPPVFKPATHLQVQDAVIDAPLEFLGYEILQNIPDLCYEPQTPGSWHNFAYYRDANWKRQGRRKTPLRVLDLFAGCGGMSTGFENCEFTIVEAVEKNEAAMKTFSNNHRSPVSDEPKDVKVFLDQYAKDVDYRKKIEPIDHVQASPPCQGHSDANRTGGKEDEYNNELSYSFVEAVRLIRPVTASYENVRGLWKRKHIHRLKSILLQLLEIGYQVRCSCLNACDYGDPQKRPRIFLLASRFSVPLVPLPPKTHGPKSHQLPFVTARDALVSFENQFKESNTSFSNTEDRLDADTPASAVRCRPVLHYNENRRLSVDELLALQSFSHFTMHGNITEQRRQIGNAVPVETATAVAQSIRRVLLYKYAEESSHDEGSM